MTAEMDRAEIMRWRKAERERLIAARLAVDAATRAGWSERIGTGLDGIIGDVAGLVVSAYWPFRGEPDLRPWLKRVNERGGICALPVVVDKGRPLAFRTWRDGEALVRGVWNIPIPAGGEAVVPHVALAPVVGFDEAGYRLGYGGGFFDRTLASLAPRPRVFGVGYALQEITTIHPLGHDIEMTAIVTEDGVLRPSRGACR